MRTILVTGAAGFIGSHLTERLLERGDRVVGLDSFIDMYDPAVKRENLSQASGHERFTLVEGDIRDASVIERVFAVHRPDAVVHLAALAGVRPSVQNAPLFCDINVTGTMHLLDAAARHGVGRFLFGSSSSVYGNNEKAPFAEDDRIDHPISPYAATKRSGELLAHTAHHIHGLPVACLRFFTVYGPRQRPDLAIHKFMQRIAAGESIPVFGDGETSRDYTYVSDIVDGITAALERVRAFHIYNLGSKRPIKLIDLIRKIEQTVGRAAQLEHQPLPPGDVQRTWADLTRSSAELDYEPRVSLDRGLADQWQWLQRTPSSTGLQEERA